MDHEIRTEAYIKDPEILNDMVKASLAKALVHYKGIKPAYQQLEALEYRVDYGGRSKCYGFR